MKKIICVLSILYASNVVTMDNSESWFNSIKKVITCGISFLASGAEQALLGNYRKHLSFVEVNNKKIAIEAIQVPDQSCDILWVFSPTLRDQKEYPWRVIPKNSWRGDIIELPDLSTGSTASVHDLQTIMIIDDQDYQWTWKKIGSFGWHVALVSNSDDVPSFLLHDKQE